MQNNKIKMQKRIMQTQNQFSFTKPFIHKTEHFYIRNHKIYKFVCDQCVFGMIIRKKGQEKIIQEAQKYSN